MIIFIRMQGCIAQVGANEQKKEWWNVFELLLALSDRVDRWGNARNDESIVFKCQSTTHQQQVVPHQQ